MIVVPPDGPGLARAVETLRANGVVACPTETVYGLAVNPFSEAALEALFSVKGRDRGKPVLVMVADAGQLRGLVSAVSERAQRCMDAFWPGPLSLLLPAEPGLSSLLTGGKTKICVRCTSSPVAQQLCRQWEGPLTSTSANLSGEAAALSARSAAVAGVSLVIDGGTLSQSAPSTVYDPDEDLLLREGPVGIEAIRNACAP
jgi:L-threonylcarbamoyladenylate synthase